MDYPEPASVGAPAEPKFAAGSTSRQVSWARLFAGSAVGVVCLWLAFRRVPIGGVGRVLGSVRLEWVALGVVAILCTTVLCAWRWRQLFPPDEPRLPLGRLWTILVIGHMMNILLPVRAGDVARLFLVQQVDGRAKGETLGTMGVEKLLDSAVFLVMVGMLSALMEVLAGLEPARTSFLWLTLALLVAAGAVIAAGDGAVRIVQGVAVLPERWKAALTERALGPFVRGARAVRRRSVLLTSLALSALAWAAAWWANYCCPVRARDVSRFARRLLPN